MEYNKVAIDFEYVANGDNIRHLICCAMHGQNGQEMRFWLRDGRDTKKLVAVLKQMRKDTNYCLVSHAMEIAEAKCFKILGLDPTEFNWIDTWLTARLLTNSFFANQPESCSLAECLAKYCDIQIDLEYKKECRGYCILDATEGHEDEILDYCASDVHYLIDLSNAETRMYLQQLSTCGCILKDAQFDESTLVNLAYVVNCSSEIADRGFPVDNDALAMLKEKVPSILMSLKQDFEKQYPGTFVFSTLKGKLKATKKSNAVYDYLEQFLASVDALDGWAKTKAGRASTDSGLLKEFKKQDNFAGNLYGLNKSLISVQGLVKDKDPWLQNWNVDDSTIYYQSLRAMSSSTGRCQPQISKGFIPGWAHFLYCVLNPPKGKWLVEVDFHAEETALQAVICKDPKYAEVYNARDTYLWMAWQLGQITKEQYDAMPDDDDAWKASLKKIRTPMKTFTLAWSYGAGAKHLAQLANIPLSTSEKWLKDLNYRVFANAYQYKQNLCKLTDASGRKLQGLAFGDGFCCRSIRYKGEQPKSDTVKMNWPFQGFGAYILREIIKRCHERRLYAIATIHDAVMFLVDEGSEEQIQQCLDVMSDTARDLLSSDILHCHRNQVAIWKNHSLSDILDADLSTDEAREAFREKVGNLVDIEDVEKFQKFLR